jgi:uncharacterized membrane protein HdeD (DUF308 family)
VIVGADEYGRKELLAMTDGFRESTQSWREVLLDLKRRGLNQDPKLAIGDGALGFWTALREVFPTTREQRCWVHKTINVLNDLPKSVQTKAKAHLHDIWQAETRAKASAAFDFFVEAYGAKWDKAVAKLVKDRDALLTFYDFPAEHWKHIRTSNPIESTFATVRHRTRRTKGCLSRKTGLAMAYRLMMSAQNKWRKLDGQNRLPEVIERGCVPRRRPPTSNRRLIARHQLSRISPSILALVYPLITNVAFAVFLGWMLLLSGIVQAVTLIGGGKTPDFWLQLISAALSVIVGFLFLRNPAVAVGTLVMLMSVFFMMEGISKTVFFLTIRPFPNWGWVLASGMLGILIAAWLLANPGMHLLVLGILIGVHLIAEGIAIATMAWMVRK